MNESTYEYKVFFLVDLEWLIEAEHLGFKSPFHGPEIINFTTYRFILIGLYNKEITIIKI